MDASVNWRIASGPLPGPWEGKDVVGWLWTIEREEQTKQILIEVSGTAMAVAPETLPDVTKQARETRGLSEVKRLLKAEEPPSRITLGTTGYIGSPPFEPASEMEEGWWVRLQGERFDLEELVEMFSAPELTVVERGDDVYLRSTAFDELEDAGDVRTQAVNLARLANGLARVHHDGFRPVDVDVVTRVSTSGTKEHFVSLGVAIEARARVRADLTVMRPDGSEAETVDPTPAEQRGSVPLDRDDVVRLLRIFAQADLRWSDLYHAFEIVQADVGGRMFENGWVSRAAVDRFKQTANSPTVLGEAARHGRETTTPPLHPMPFEEAEGLVKGLVQTWLRSLPGSTSA
ncbi:MAG: hypothetical protein WEA81_07570 [Dehalococcoidia bacterium]